MKPLISKTFFYCFLLFSINCTAQFKDAFDDADLRKNPSWFGDTSHFEINANKQLHLKAPAVTGKSLLVTESEVSTSAVWKFWVQLDFNPSSSNYAKVYLISDQARIDSSLNGYYLRLGGTDDDISLFRQDGATSKLIIDGRNGQLGAAINKVSVEVLRTLKGEWTVSCDSTGQSNFSRVGTAFDSTYFLSKYYGIQCVYSATRSTKFLFDNFEVTGKKSTDTIPPIVQSIETTDDSLVTVEFSEDIKNINFEGNYKLSAGFAIKVLQVKDNKSVMLFLNSPVPCMQKLEVRFTGISDLAGNTISDTSLYVSYCPGNAFDVLLTEIMADPDPQVLLPNLEYLEMYNRSGALLNLNNWSLQVGSDKISIPEVLVPTDSFLILCSSNGCSQFPKNLHCLDILPSNLLNNSGEYMGLNNQKGKLIHWVNYDETFYKNELKKSGGWSLEMIDPENPCAGIVNWKASNDSRGGTPGKRNSVNGTVSDLKSFQYEHIYLPNDSTVRIYFSKPVNIENLKSNMFLIDEGMASPQKIKYDSVQHLFVDLIFNRPFPPGTLYTLQLSENLSDCSGNKITDISTIPFMKPSQVTPNDIIINEILFNAMTGEQEFIEFYNNSNKFISSDNLKLAYKSTSADYTSAFSLGGYPFLISPHSFTIAVKSPEGLKEHFHIPDMRLVAVCNDFSTLSNEEGCVALMNRSLEMLDEFCYSEKMHFNLLVNKSGVSLERIHYDKPTSDSDNWHSASSSDGFATPGLQNSQYLEKAETANEIGLEYEIFSPDNDGYKDVETISYHLDKPGFVASIIVFDALGRRIKVISNNQTLGIQGTFTWNGIDEKGRLADTGIYLIYIELHHPSGEVKHYKKTCVLGGELKR